MKYDLSNSFKAECEIWKDIEHYEGYYQVSNLGNVKSLDRIVNAPHGKTLSLKGSLMNFIIDNWGYETVSLSRYGKLKRYRVNRLVAIAFIPNPENKPQVDHEFGNKLDNRASKLRWVTASENTKNNFKLGLRSLKGEQNNSSKLTLQQVNEIRIMSLNSKINRKEVAKKYNVCPTTITNILNNKNWKSC